MQKVNAVCADYLIIFGYLLRIFFATFFKRRLQKITQGNPLKITLNGKQSNFEKKTYGNISLYSQYFSPRAGSDVHKTYFYFLKLTKKYFTLSSWVEKAQ